MPFPHDQLVESWRTPRTAAGLTHARNRLHWAAQIPASIGYTFARPEADWSHTSLTGRFVDDAYVLVSWPAEDIAGMRAGLRLHDVTLLAFDAAHVPIATFALEGTTLEDGYAWLAAQVQRHGAPAAKPLVRPDHELPHDDVADGAPFTFERPACRALADWYACAEHTLRVVVPRYPEASPIRCWPHHFDLATLLTLDPECDPEVARSIGAGFVPGDSSYGEPYFYVTPWPYPEAPKLPMLEGGHWHEEGWFGAVLPGSELLDAGDAPEQVAYLLQFLESAIEAAHRLLVGDQ